MEPNGIHAKYHRVIRPLQAARGIRLVFLHRNPSVTLSMRYLAVVGALWLLATVSPATAQIQVTAQTSRTNFLLYERVDLVVTVTNIGDNDLVLNNEEKQHPWLSFLVSRHVQQNYMPIRQERDSNFAPVTLKAGENKTFRVNLTPLFTFREEGQYRAAAVVDLPGEGQIVSDNVPFSVQRGQKVWSQMRPVDGSERIYSLIRFSPDSESTELYLRVEDPAENLVYANLGIGQLAASVDPEVLFDPQGNIHILHPTALGTYLYTRTDPNGKMLHQGIFKTQAVRGPNGVERIRPRLAKLNDGNATVIGGMEQNPNVHEEKLSEGQVPQSTTETIPPAPPASAPGANGNNTPAPSGH